MKWLHRLFNPHCEHCISEAELNSICNSCEVLKHELELMRMERDKLLDRLINVPQIKDREVNTNEPVPFKPSFVPTHVRRQMLETEDRIKKRALENAPKPVNEIEKDLGIENATTN